MVMELRLRGVEVVSCRHILEVALWYHTITEYQFTVWVGQTAVVTEHLSITYRISRARAVPMPASPGVARPFNAVV